MSLVNHSTVNLITYLLIPIYHKKENYRTLPELISYFTHIRKHVAGSISDLTSLYIIRSDDKP